jgi:hypothetical protein
VAVGGGGSTGGEIGLGQEEEREKGEEREVAG